MRSVSFAYVSDLLKNKSRWMHIVGIAGAYSQEAQE